MTCIHSFPPLSAPGATILILGTMPGVASLAASQYYAHPRNAFWHMIEAVLDIPLTLPYEERCRRVVARNIAVWDVLKTCTRSGSLDSAIEKDSIVTNDFAGFFAQHPHIQLICLNGTKAAEVWRRHIVPDLPPAIAAVPTQRLPSTSPAHAGMPLATKIARWREALKPAAGSINKEHS
ncbi:MAG: DNA-deoxyinosine glycosylase [Pseudomonadota bacterium]|nr:DNA-deoxyinosine glycosylase [Pseudomonadota bacterium]